MKNLQTLNRSIAIELQTDFDSKYKPGEQLNCPIKLTTTRSEGKKEHDMNSKIFGFLMPFINGTAHQSTNISNGPSAAIFAPLCKQENDFT